MRPEARCATQRATVARYTACLCCAQDYLPQAEAAACPRFKLSPTRTVDPLSMKKGRASSGGCCVAQSRRALSVVVASWARLSIASWWEDKADWSSLRWRISLRTVRRPGGRWRLWERRVVGG